MKRNPEKHLYNDSHHNSKEVRSKLPFSAVQEFALLPCKYNYSIEYLNPMANATHGILKKILHYKPLSKTSIILPSFFKCNPCIRKKTNYCYDSHNTLFKSRS